MKLGKWVVLSALSLAALLGTSGCVSLFLAKAPSKVIGRPASPEILGAFQGDAPVSSPADWTERRAPILREEFQKLIYGREPAPFVPVITARRDLDLKEVRDFAYVEQLTIQVSAQGPNGEAPFAFNMLIFSPKSSVDSAAGPLPILVMQNFCGNRAIFHRRPPEIAATLTKVYPMCNDGSKDWMVEAILGKYISGPPLKKVLGKGYAIATMYAGDVVADTKEDAPAALARLADGKEPAPGALMAWAWTFSRAVEVLSKETRFDPQRIVIWGHSRNGKDALLAAALDPRIAGVIAHQSGRGGAALTRSSNGETVEQITTSYPYWFTPGFKGFAGKENALPIDQHQLIALIAPRPVLLGNGRADNWADPEGAYRALIGADPVYKLMGSSGLQQQDMQHPELSADLSFFIRPGNHGSTTRDWTMFLGWMDAHFKYPRSAATARPVRQGKKSS